MASAPAASTARAISSGDGNTTPSGSSSAKGYDLTYVTDIDTHQRAVAGSARIFLSVGHDEYWSWQMREHVEGARDRGVHLGFLGADACFWQIRFEPSARGDADRTIVAYKEAAGDLDPLAIDGRHRRTTG